MNLTFVTFIVVVFAIAAVLFALSFARANSVGSAKQTFVRPQRVKSFKRQWRKIHLLPIGLHRLRTWLPGSRGPCGVVQFANIGEGTLPTGARSMLPDAVTNSRYLLYKRGSDADHVALCGAGEDPLGTSDDQADSVTTPITIHVCGAFTGTRRCVTDGTIADGDYIKSAANGKATKALTGEAGQFGRAVIPTDCTRADGDVIQYIGALPAKYAF